MNFHSIFSVLTLMFVFMSGCAVKKDLAAIDGSKADGTVKLSYDFGTFQIPKVNEEQGLDVAKQRCIAWGYTGAEKFAGSSRTCTRYFGGDACTRWTVTVNYQCTNEPI